LVGPANAADLSLQRIMLSSGGVGYFEYEATVDGNATLSLDVPLDQVDDILKSLVVYDDGGTAGEVTPPGREPLTQTFVDLPFDRTALDSAPTLLNALQGAEVRVTGAKPMNGRLLRVVEETSRGAAIHLGGCRQHRLCRSRTAEKGRRRAVATCRLPLRRTSAPDPRKPWNWYSEHPGRLRRRGTAVESLLSTEPFGRSPSRPRTAARLGDT
jgi:hypothetical protein